MGSSQPKSHTKICSCGCDCRGINSHCTCSCSPINRLCHTFHNKGSAQQFKNAPEKYCRSFGLSQREIEAVTDLDVMRLLELGAKPECLEALTSLYQLSVDSLGAQQSGLSEESFREKIQAPK